MSVQLYTWSAIFTNAEVVFLSPYGIVIGLLATEGQSTGKSISPGWTARAIYPNASLDATTVQNLSLKSYKWKQDMLRRSNSFPG